MRLYALFGNNLILKELKLNVSVNCFLLVAIIQLHTEALFTGYLYTICWILTRNAVIPSVGDG